MSSLENRSILETSSELLNAVRDAPENAKCFDCSDKISPRYLCVDFLTLVCSCCANIHKEFGHKIKCMNVFVFSLREINALKYAGNKAAAEKWLALWPADDKEPDPTSPTYKEDARAYIRAKYIEGRWCFKDLGHSNLPPIRLHQQHDGKQPAYYAASPTQSPRVVDPMTFPPSPYSRPQIHVPANFNKYSSPLGPIPFNVAMQRPDGIGSPDYNIPCENPPPLPPRPALKTPTSTTTPKPAGQHVNFCLSPPVEYTWHPMAEEHATPSSSAGMLRSSSENSIGVYMRGLAPSRTISSSSVCDPEQLDKQGRAKWKVTGIVSKMADLLSPKKLAA